MDEEEEAANRFSTPMSDDERMGNARAFRDISHSNQQFAEQRSEDVSGEFTRLEVQIATILFAFAGFFVTSFTDGKVLDVFWMKLMFSFAMAFLLLSLVMGLLQLKRVESFWDERLGQRNLRFREWRKAAKREVTFEEAQAFERGTAMGKGNLIFVPRWAWILQTVFLGCGVTFLFVLFLAF